MVSPSGNLAGLFHPRSVAIVGLPRGLKTGKLYLFALRDQGFSGPIYAVNPKAEEIDGLVCYPSITAIPGPVDLAIVLVPNTRSLEVIRECGKKGVKAAVLFTAGYKELGTGEGQALETRLLEEARASGLRLIGPNGMGFYCPESGLSFFPDLPKEPGPVGILSHSGSLTNIVCRLGPDLGLSFSKVVSLGNECDLTMADFLDVLTDDAETRVVAAYVEGIRNGPAFFEALKKAAVKKPVILWKMGLTREGVKAAGSHTGALAGSAPVWKGMVEQTGAVTATGFEDWLDLMMGFALLPETLGNRMAIISGPGGLAVSAAEACGNNGLELAGLSESTRQDLSGFVPGTGTSLANPIDLGMSSSLDVSMYVKAARAAAADPGVDAVAIAGIGFSDETNQAFTKGVIQARKDSGKPFLMIKIPGFDPVNARRFTESGLPFFQSAERAMATYARVHAYRSKHSKYQPFPPRDAEQPDTE